MPASQPLAGASFRTAEPRYWSANSAVIGNAAHCARVEIGDGIVRWTGFGWQVPSEVGFDPLETPLDLHSGMSGHRPDQPRHLAAESGVQWLVPMTSKAQRGPVDLERRRSPVSRGASRASASAT